MTGDVSAWQRTFGPEGQRMDIGHHVRLFELADDPLTRSVAPLTRGARGGCRLGTVRRVRSIVRRLRRGS